jgi:branched-chain amino acid transport system permease protein
MLSGAVIMQRLMLIFWEQTSGEEGINGIEPLIRSQPGLYYFALAVLALVTALLLRAELAADDYIRQAYLGVA